MIDQELAGVMKFVIAESGVSRSYYGRVPQGFRRPAIYFPPPRISAGLFSLTSMSDTVLWYIRFFADTSAEAFGAAGKAVQAMQKRRFQIPNVDETGAEEAGCTNIGMTAGGFTEPEYREVDDGAVMLTLQWTSPRVTVGTPDEKIDVVKIGMGLKGAV